MSSMSPELPRIGPAGSTARFHVTARSGRSSFPLCLSLRHRTDSPPERYAEVFTLPPKLSCQDLTPLVLLHYGVPMTFVRVPLKYVLSSVTVVLFVLYACGYVVQAYLNWSSRLASQLWPALVAVLVLPWLVALVGLFRPFYLVAAGALAGLSLVQVLVAVLNSRARKAIGALADTVGTRTAEAVLGTRAVWLISAFVLLLVFSFNLGDWSAGSMIEYPVLRTPTESVVLLQYGETLVCAPLVRSRKEYLREFTVLRADRGEPLVFTVERIGPLRAAAPATAPVGLDPAE